MTALQIANGHDNEAGYTEIAGECPLGVQYPAFGRAVDGTVFARGEPFAVIDLGGVQTDADFKAIFTAAGLTLAAGVVTGNVTVSLPNIDPTAAFNNWNAVFVWRAGVDGEYPHITARHWRNTRIYLYSLAAT